MSIESVISSNYLSLCLPILLLPLIFPSIRVFSNESSLLDQVAKISELQLYHQSFQWISSVQFSCSVLSIPMNIQHWFPLELTDLISLLSKGISSLFQHHSSKASILWHSAFFMVQPLHPYMTTGKPIALIIWTFAGKVMSLLFNILSRFVNVFLPKSKLLLISWLPSLTTVILEENKVCHFPLFPHLSATKWLDRTLWSSLTECWILSQLFHSPLSLSSGFLVTFCFLPLPLGRCHLHMWGYCHFSRQS